MLVKLIIPIVTERFAKVDHSYLDIISSTSLLVSRYLLSEGALDLDST
jgi:hypothetical protein